MRYLLSVSYDGSKFNGFQKLKNELTVQGELERVISKIAKKPVSVKGAGRTDKGAHALDQKCHFEIDMDLDIYNIKRSINDLINKSIYVKDCQKISEKLHARFSVKEKCYRYYINNIEYNPIRKDYIYYYRDNLNFSKIQEAINLFIGQHSFKNFVCGQRKNYNSEIKNARLYMEGNDLCFEFIGGSFYTYMIRNMVGALLEIGKGKMSYQELKELIDNKTEIKNYTTVPACGLYLIYVKY